MSLPTQWQGMIQAMLQPAFYLLLFILSFFATSAWVRGYVPERLKIEWCETVQEDAEVLFLGSSHVFRQFDPSLFDELRRAKDKGLRSYNLGTVGMEFAEELYLLRRILLENPPNLNWIVVEAQPFRVGFRNDKDFGKRRIGWHDYATTKMLLSALVRSDLPTDQRWELALRHVEHWWRRTINFARGMNAWDALGKDFEAMFPDTESLGANQDGYLPLELSTASQLNRGMRKGFLKAPGIMLEGRKVLLQAGDGGAPEKDLLAAVRAMEKLAAEKDITIVWWLHPNFERLSGWRQMERQGDIEHLVAHDDPQVFPEFYEVEWRFDAFHLNRQGAELLTRSFAKDFVALQKGVQE